MKKRLRKKLGVGEFTELGFEFYATIADADDLDHSITPFP